MKKILAVSSSGGHWAELLRLRPAFGGHQVTYLTTQHGARQQLSDARIYRVTDANQWNKCRLLITLIQVALVVLWVRPHVIISTGAAPGYFAIRLGKLLGARTLWLESLANAEHISLSTKLVLPYADMALTQWPHMAGETGLQYKGSVL